METVMGVRAMRSSRRCAAAVAVLALSLVVPLGAKAAPELTVKGDAKVWAEIEAVLTRFARVKSYRAKGTMGAGSMTMEYVNPNRFHITMGAGDEGFESIQVGSEIRVRIGNGQWMCNPGGQPANVPNLKPEQMKGEVSATKGPVVPVDGVQSQSYKYTWKSEYISSNFALFVALNTGLPKRMQVLDDKGAAQSTFDYFDYDAPITIELPACK